LAEWRLSYWFACRTPRRRSAEGVEEATGAEAEGFTAEAVEGSTGAEAGGFMAVVTTLAGVAAALMAAEAFTAERGEWAEARTAGWADMGVVRRTIPRTAVAGGCPAEIG